VRHFGELVRPTVAHQCCHSRYFALLDDVRADAHRKAIQLALFHNVEHTGQIARTIESKTRALIHQKSFSLLGDSTRCFDVVKDVVNLAPIHWIADTLVSDDDTVYWPLISPFCRVCL
jgi:linoleate 10R-lipoxygenase